MYTHTHTHNLIVLSRTHSGLPIFHIVKKGKKKKKRKKKLYADHKAEVMMDEGNRWGEEGGKHAGELGCVPGKGL